MTDTDPHRVYTQTIKMFAAPASPPFEDEAELERHWRPLQSSRGCFANSIGRRR
jgi:hypothetical protein